MTPAIPLFALALCAAAVPAQQQQFSELGRSPLGVTADYAYAVATGDVDGDGADDVIFSETFAGLQLFKSDRHGGFAKTTLPYSGQITELDLVDLDGDGDRDLVVGVGFSAGTRNRFLLNDGSGNFSTPIFFSNASNDTRATLVADFDGDHDVDVLFFNRYGSLYSELYLNDGKAYFTSAHTQVPQFPQEQAWSAAAGDVDGDGDLDIIVGNAESRPNMHLFLNDGSGAFTDASSRLPLVLADTMAVALCDIDADGDADIVAASGQAAFSSAPPLQTRVYVNDGFGSFVDQTVARMPVDADKTESMVTADFDGDGDLDIWLGNDGQSRLYLNDGAGFFIDASSRIPPDSDRSSNVAAGDFDSDGDLDIVSTSYSPNPNRIYFNLLRHLDIAPDLAIGSTSSVEVHASPGFATGSQTVLPLIAGGTASIHLGGLGTLGLDPGSMIGLPQLTLLAPAGRGSLPLQVPNAPSLRGFTVAMQALILDPAAQLRLTNTAMQIIR